MRRIKKAKVDFISLVPRGANKMRTIYKSDDQVEIQTLIKAGEDFEEQGELLSVAYAPDIVDAQGDWADQVTVRKMAHDFMRNPQVDIRHDGKAVTQEQAYIAESFIVQKGDPRFTGFTDYEDNEVDVTGAWATVIKIDDPDLRAAYRDGAWNGVSIGGTAEFESDDSSMSKAIGQWFAKTFPSFLAGGSRHEEEPMTQLTKEDVQGLQDAIGALTQALTKAPAEPEPTPEPDLDPDPNTPVLKAEDANDPEKVRQHLAALELAKIDWSDAEQVRKHLDTLEGRDPAPAPSAQAPQGDLTKSSSRLSIAEMRELGRKRGQELHKQGVI